MANSAWVQCIFMCLLQFVDISVPVNVIPSRLNCSTMAYYCHARIIVHAVKRNDVVHLIEPRYNEVEMTRNYFVISIFLHCHYCR